MQKVPIPVEVELEVEVMLKRRGSLHQPSILLPRLVALGAPGVHGGVEGSRLSKVGEEGKKNVLDCAQ